MALIGGPGPASWSIGEPVFAILGDPVPRPGNLQRRHVCYQSWRALSKNDSPVSQWLDARTVGGAAALALWPASIPGCAAWVSPAASIWSWRCSSAPGERPGFVRLTAPKRSGERHHADIDDNPVVEAEPIFKGIAFARKLREQGHEVQVLTGFPNYPEGRLYECAYASGTRRSWTGSP